jgi:hypothetical protein
MTGARYYVYVYIDPRNNEEFYYGKGTGSRKLAHLGEEGDSEKVARINDIREEGLHPVVRVIAAGLEEKEALLIEKTLIWKLGRTLTNEATGHYSEKFRPHNTLHKEIPGFDFENDIYYVNIGEGDHRDWADCKKYGFLSAGGENPLWKSQIQKLVKGDVVAAYLAKHGYVGIGIVTEQAVPLRDFLVDGVPLCRYDLAQPGLCERIDDNELTEYLARVKWIKSVGKSQAFFRPKADLFTTQLIRASLSRQQKTIAFLENQFEVDIRGLLAESLSHVDASTANS